MASPAIEEIGTWEATGADSVRVTITGQQERVYDKPQVTDYVWQDAALRSEDGLALTSQFGHAMSIMAQLQDQTSSFVDVNGGTLDEQALSNATYDLPDFGSFQLQGGKYEKSTGSGASQVNQAFFQTMALGDLDGDTVDDAVVVIAINTGGSGSFFYLVAVLNQDGKPTQAGQDLLGDRVQVSSLSVADGRIVIDMKVAGPSDPLCCPSLPVQRTYELQDGVLVMVEESR